MSSSRFGFALALLAALPAAAGPLTLRVQDAVGTPGGRVAFVLRTYQSKPIGQGQTCLQVATDIGSVQALDAINGATVFSTQNDAVSTLSDDLLNDPQLLTLDFSSASGSVNSADGPLAVVFATLDPALVPGTSYAVSLDLFNSFLVDGNGVPIQLGSRAGVLSVRASADPIRFGAAAEDVVPGNAARLSAVTFEPVPLSRGRVGFRYDPAVAAGPPVVTMDWRHGHATFTVDPSAPGLVVVDFQSTDRSLNSVPGDIVEIFLPTSPLIAAGTTSQISLDPATTFLVDAEGATVPLSLERGTLTFGSAAPGAVSDLRLAKASGGKLELSWGPDCGSGTGFAIYRGDLARGYASIGPEPGMCDVESFVATVPAGEGAADFFLVVPNVAGVEGSYGLDSRADARPPAGNACFPQTTTRPCEP